MPSRFLLVLVLLVAHGVQAEDLDPQAKLLAAVRHVDRMVVLPSELTPPDEHRSLDDILFEINGRQKIEELVQQLDFAPEPDTYRQPCMCLGTHRLEFYSDGRFKFSLIYSHWEALRGDLGGPWFSDAVMSAEGRAAFIEWFARNGFSEFKEQKMKAEEWAAKDEAQRAQVAAYFPENVRPWIPAIHHNRSWEPEDKQHAAELASLYANRVDLVLSAWRALGQLVSWSKDGYGYLYGEPSGFLLTSLKKVSTHDIAGALDSLRDDDTLARLGAFFHSDSLQEDDASTAAEWPAGWPEQLAIHYYDHGQHWKRGVAVRFLNGLSTDAARSCLLNIGARAQPRADESPAENESYFFPKPSAEIMALYHLAKIQFPEARSAIESKLQDAPSGQDRLALEIALAYYGDTTALGPQHLNCNADRGGAAEFAWTAILSRNESSPPAIDLLLAGTRSENYSVKDDAEARLLKLGLRPAAKFDMQEEVDVDVVIDRRLSGQEAIDACTAALAAKPESLTAAALRVRRGLSYLEVGNYEAARLDLEQNREGMRAPESTAYKLAVAAFAIGRFGQAAEIAWRDSRSGKSAAHYLTLHGCIHYALDDFAEAADWFTAGYVLGGDEYALTLRHLALLQLNSAEHSPLRRWGPTVVLGETNIEEAVNAWPNPLLRWLQGGMDEGTLFEHTSEDSWRADVKTRLCWTHWTISQVARAKHDIATERSHLEKCIAAGAFTSLPHVLALARMQSLKEMTDH